MKHKIYLMLGSLLVLLLAVMGLMFWQNRQTIEASTISIQQQEMIAGLPDFPEDVSAFLMFRGEAVPYDTSRNIYYFPLNTEKNVRKETGFFASQESLKIYWCEDPFWSDLTQAVAQGHEFSFYMTNGEFARESRIVFTGLPLMRLNTIEVLDEENSYCSVTVFDPFHQEGGGYEIFNCKGYLRLRGKTSKSFPKKGFNLDFVKDSGEPFKTNLLGLRTDDDWKLNALYPDATKVREAVAMDLWNELAEQTENIHDTGTKMEYFEMIMDGDYRGLYGAMEQLDFKQFCLDKSEDVIYKGYAWPLEGNIDKGTLGTAIDYCGYWIKTGTQPVSEKLWHPFVEYAEAANFAEQKEICDTDAFYDYIQQHMDMENFLNLEFYVQMLYAFDNKYKNLYIAADLQDDENYTLTRIPWDLNYSFGDRYSAENTALTTYNPEWATEIMPHFMMSETLLEAGHEAFTQTLNAQWDKLKETVFRTEHVKELAEKYRSRLISSGAFERDTTRWPDGPHNTSLEELVEFHENRLEFLDKHYRSFLNE